MLTLLIAMFTGAIGGYILGHHAGWTTATDFWENDVKHWREMHTRADKHITYLTQKWYG